MKKVLFARNIILVICKIDSLFGRFRATCPEIRMTFLCLSESKNEKFLNVTVRNGSFDITINKQWSDHKIFHFLMKELGNWHTCTCVSSVTHCTESPFHTVVFMGFGS